MIPGCPLMKNKVIKASATNSMNQAIMQNLKDVEGKISRSYEYFKDKAIPQGHINISRSN
jgi:hypothetical protein